MQSCLRTTFWWLLLALPACGEAFAVSGATGGGGSGGVTSSQGGGGSGGQGGAATSVSAGGTGGAGGCAPRGSGDCDACLLESCGDAYCACDEASGCIDLLDCYASAPSSPPSVAYLQFCWQNNAGSIATAGNLLACGGNVCADLCDLAPVSDCSGCLYENCPKEVNGCFSLYDCTALLECVGACAEGDSPCATGCAIDHQAGAQPAASLDECSQKTCADSCN